jgi:hypothetical protein
MRDDLLHAQAAADWATAQIPIIHEAIGAWQGTRPYEFAAERDDQTGEKLIVAIETKQRMLAALAGGPLPQDPNQRARLELRWRSTVDHLRHHKLAHGIMVGPEKSGYVWSHYPFTDEQWKARANMIAHHGQYPLPIIRLSVPQARVVIITGPVLAIDESQEAPAKPVRERQEEPI